MNKNKWDKDDETVDNEGYETNMRKHEATNKRGRGEEELVVEKVIKTESIIFIPYTPNSELKKKLQTWENKFSKTMNIERIKFIKGGGAKLKT